MTMDLLTQLRSTIGEAYDVEREIGRGGMATVFLATDRKHGRSVALKVMDPAFDFGGGAARFQREIQSAARLTHPNVLALLDSGEAGELRYYVMPYVEGESLRQRLERERQLPVGESLRITRALASGLAHAHERGLVHRDIKPENVLLTGDSVLLADFGIARVTTGVNEKLTATGLSLGTPNYMSPEQAGGGQVDARADQYALACVLYEMLTGHPPFQGSSWQEVLGRHALDAVPPVRSARPTVPPAMDRAISRALSKVPADRFADMAEFAAALPTAEEAERYVPGTDQVPVVRPAPRRGLAVAGSAALLALAAFGIWRLTSVRGTAGDRIFLAVLPLVNVGDSADAYFADGLSEEITARLSRVSGIAVMARNNSLRAQDSGQTAQAIGRSLGVRYVLAGSVRWETTPDGGRTVRVTPQLVDVDSNTVVCCEPSSAQMASVFKLQTEISEAVVGRLKVTLGSSDSVALRTSPTQNPEAFRHYATGRFLWKQRTPSGLTQSVAAFKRALASDSNYARAWSGLADAYVLFAQYGVPGLSPGEAFAEAKNAATRALALNPSLAEAHASLGEIATYADFDWPAAEQHLRQSIHLDPDYATAHHWYSELLAIMGRFEESLAEARRAEQLDPSSAVIAHATTLPLFGLRRYGDAVEQFKRVLELDPAFGYAHFGLTWTYAAQRDLARTLAQLQAMGDTTALMAAWARGVVDPAQRPAARQVAARYADYIGRLPRFLRAPFYAGLGDADNAIATLEAAAASRDFAVLGINILPIYDGVRADPRFQALRARLKL
jgi:eukaryotic-like serine/threonine-protein kinase